MQLRYQELVGKEVVAADGHRLGRVADLVAEAQDDALRVTALLVGPTALLGWLTFPAVFHRILRAQRVPWHLVARIDDDIHLRVADHDLARLDHETRR